MEKFWKLCVVYEEIQGVFRFYPSTPAETGIRSPFIPDAGSDLAWT